MREICNFCVVFCYLLINSSRTLGNLKGLDQSILNIIGASFGFVNAGSRVTSGYLLDRYGFQKIMSVITIVELLVSVTVYLAANSSIFYLIENALVAFSLGATFTLIPPYYDKTFGRKQGLKIYAISGVSAGVCSIVGSLMIKYLVKNLTDYLIIFLISAIFIVVQAITLLFLNDGKYLYKKNVTNFVFKYNKDTVFKPTINNK